MISIVLPVLNEAATLAIALRELALQKGDYEVIVVDGGSHDDTTRVARAAGAQVVLSERGRGRQMNCGAAAAIGEYLVFLHVDTTLPAGAMAAIEQAFRSDGVVGGGFRKRYDGGGLPLVLTGAALNRIRSRWLGHLVGSQGLFCRRDLFVKLGGFPDWPLLEDVGFSDKLRRVGRIACLPDAVTVSTRRYRQRGVLHQILANATVLSLFRLGVAPARLVRLYQGRHK